MIRRVGDVDDALRKRMLDMRMDFFTIGEIAERTDCTVSVVMGVMKAAGVSTGSRVWTEESRAELKRMIDDGKTAVEAAGAFGVTAADVRSVANYYGLGTFRRQDNPVWTERRVAKVVTMISRGMTADQVAEELDVSRDAIYVGMRRHGIRIKEIKKGMKL